MSSSSGEGGCGSPGSEGYTPLWHWAAVITVLLASALGPALPVMSRHSTRLSVPEFIYVVGKCTSTGVLIAVSLVHMLQPSQAAMQSECVGAELREINEPVPFTICVMSILVMHTLELCMHTLASAAALASDPGLGSATTVRNAADESHGNAVERVALLPCSGAGSAMTVGCKRNEAAFHGHSHFGDFGHSHRDTGEDARASGSSRRFMEAVFLEIGVSLHSVFVGLVLGVSRDKELSTLLAAVCLHQFFEGIALGSRLVEMGLHVKREVLFTIIFAMSAPIGAVVGTVGVTCTSLNVNSEPYLITQGVLDAACAGILLYLGLSMLLGDFPRDLGLHCWRTCEDGRSRLDAKKAAAMTLSLYFGAATMCGIGWYA